MRGIASVFALGLMMALFHRVTAGAALEARATLALGFLLLAAFLGGDLARRARLPRITGYVLVGFVVGPWLGLVRHDEVDALRFIGDVALGVIALAAGSELALPPLRGQLVALGRLVGGAIVVPLLVVAAVLLSVSPWFPLTVHQPTGDAVAVALALGGLAAVSSPAVAMGMLSELGAGGPFARTLLAVTVLKDVAAAILFTLLLAAGKAFASAGALNASAAGHALLSLAASLAVGALLGYGVSRYLRLLRRHTPLFLVCRRPGCSRGGARRAARDHPRRARRRALPREFLPGRGGAGASRAETGVAVRLHLILRPGGCRPAPERLG